MLENIVNGEYFNWIVGVVLCIIGITTYMRRYHRAESLLSYKVSKEGLYGKFMSIHVKDKDREELVNEQTTMSLVVFVMGILAILFAG